MKHITAYLVILLLLLMLYYTYDIMKVKEGHKTIEHTWHNDKKFDADGVEHSHPMPWATNKPGEGKVDIKLEKSDSIVPESVNYLENNGYTCLPIIDGDTSHQEAVIRQTSNSSIGNGLDEDGSYTTSTSDGTVITGDTTTEEWKNTLEDSEYTYPDKRSNFWNKVQNEFLGDAIATYSQKYTLMNIVSNIIGGKLSSYDYHIDKAKTEKYLAFYAEKTGKPTSTICNHYHSASNQLNEILNIDNGYHNGSNRSLKSINPPPCEEGEEGDCIYGWAEENLSFWKNEHKDIINKIDTNCS